MITSNQPDPAHYKAGVFYFNRDDRRLFVPKRIGIGYTLNFARPATWVFLAIIGAVVVAVYYGRR